MPAGAVMSEFGAGLTMQRIDGVVITEEEALGLVAQMRAVATAADRAGFFDHDALSCGLGWSEDDGAYTLVVTSSPAYKFGLPEDIAEAAMAEATP